MTIIAQTIQYNFENINTIINEKQRAKLISPIKQYDYFRNSDLSAILKHHRIAVCPQSENDYQDIKIYEVHKEKPTIVISNAHNDTISNLFEFDHDILVSFSSGEHLIKFWSIRKYDYKLLHTLNSIDINRVYRLPNKLVTLNYKNDDSRESTLHLWNVHPFENKWEKELKFRGNVYDILEVKEKELIIVPYIDVTPENKYLRDDGVLLINSSTFQIVSNIKHDDMCFNYPLLQFDSNRVLMGGGKIVAIDLEKKTIESISGGDCYCFGKVNDEIVIYGGIRKIYFLEVNKKKQVAVQKKRQGGALRQQ